MKIVMKSGLGCGTMLALFLAIGMVGACATSAFTPKQPEPAPQEQRREEPPVSKDTTYEVTRVDVRRGALGDTVALDGGSEQYAAYTADMKADGTLTFDIYGVQLTAKATRGDEANHIYSGQETKVTQLKLDGENSKTVGTVFVSVFQVDEGLLVDLTGREDGQLTTYTFYLMPPLQQ